MATNNLTPVQMQLLKLFMFKDEKVLDEMNIILRKHIRDKVDREGERVWKEKGMTNETIRELENAHFRISSDEELNERNEYGIGKKTSFQTSFQ